MNYHNSKSYSYSTSSDEEKISVRVDSCLLCAQVAITYDCEGNVIKQEPCSEFEEVRKPNWSNDQLFLFLCRSFDLEKKKNYSGLQLDPFPFCGLCELLINSLGDVYTKLDELKNVLRGKIEKAEEVYLRDNLYEKHSNEYLVFRKDALGVAWKNPRKVLESRKRLTSKWNSSSKGASKSRANETVSETPSHVEVPDSEGSRYSSRVLRKRTSPLKYEEPSSEDEVDKVVTKSVTVSPSKTAIKKPTKRKPPKRVKNVDVDTGPLPPVVSPSAPEASASQVEFELQFKPKKRQRGRMEIDQVTGNMTFTINLGNRYKSSQGSLLFKLVKGSDGTEWYECSDCPSTRLPVLSRKENQRGPFRKHYIDFHSKRHKCQLCPEALNNFGLHSQLVKHLASSHEIFSMNSYYKAIGMPYNLKRTLSVRKSCEICQMPYIGSRQHTYKAHLMSHMNEEEKMEALLLGGNRSTYKEIIQPTPHQLENGVVALCTECGSFITKGKQGMRRHYETSHPELVDEKDKDPTPGKGRHLCPYCGNSEYKCKFPSCSQKELGEATLKKHVQEAHGQSEEADNRLLCLDCGKVLASAWCLKQHGLVHSKETPFECHLCPKRFPLKSTLKLHLATKHLVGTEMLKCEQEGCGKLFPNLKYFRTHGRKAHGIFLKGKNKQGNETETSSK
ncbi:putative zinc finger protein [Orchesella cincta]|uniref:Putative zinc finger protein n=1 Tax=Orchesella cincta TaxID=48709 RepID=A0A1D2MG23_ORCCI|nr:putative zinc finger protein [Orchesella cincta]